MSDGINASLACGAVANGRRGLDNDENTPLHMLPQAGRDHLGEGVIEISRRFDHTDKDLIGAVRCLLDTGVDPAWPNKRGRTAVHVACHFASSDAITFLLPAIKLMLDHGASMDVRDKDGKSPLGDL
jgi:ankyrin repeat protein